jgi:hypothetical protein
MQILGCKFEHVIDDNEQVDGRVNVTRRARLEGQIAIGSSLLVL